MGFMNLIVKLMADTKPFEQGMNRASKIMKDLDKQAGGRSQLKKTFELFKGGGAIAGLTLGARALEEMTEKAAELADQFRHGEIAAGDLVEELAKATPVLGSIFKAGRNIRGILFGDNPEADAKRAQAVIVQATKFQQLQKQAQRGREDVAGGDKFSKQITSARREFEDFAATVKKTVTGAKEQQSLITMAEGTMKIAEAQAVAARNSEKWAKRIDSMKASASAFAESWKTAISNRAAPFIDTLKQFGAAFTEVQNRAKSLSDSILSGAMSRLQSRTFTAESTASNVSSGSSAASAIRARIAGGQTVRIDPTQKEIEKAVKAQLKEEQDQRRLQEEILETMRRLGLVSLNG